MPWQANCMMLPGENADLYAPRRDRASRGARFLSPGSLARRKLARFVHHHHLAANKKVRIGAGAEEKLGQRRTQHARPAPKRRRPARRPPRPRRAALASLKSRARSSAPARRPACRPVVCSLTSTAGRSSQAEDAAAGMVGRPPEVVEASDSSVAFAGGPAPNPPRWRPR